MRSFAHDRIVNGKLYESGGTPLKGRHTEARPHLLPLLTLSRVLSPRNTEHTTVLDVATSLHRVSAALSFDPRKTPALEQTKTEAIASSVYNLSLHLHSRDFLPLGGAVGGHRDYRTLTLARLSRDSARVEAISKRISLAVHGVEKADLTPLLTDEEVLPSAASGGVSGPLVSGSSQGSGEYFSQVGIGQPARSAYLVVDTGSDVTWIQFSACRNYSCLYQVSYGDGSFTVGEFATETLTFGSSPPVHSVALGCGHDNEGLFVAASGLLGLGGGALSFPSQIRSPSFSYCLVARDSTATSTLDFGAGIPDSAAVTAPLLRNHKIDTFYYVGLSGISVGGELLSIPPSAFAMDESGAGGVIVDSGTAVTRLQRDAYDALRNAFARGTTDLPPAEGVALFDTCYDLSSRTSVEVPTVSLRFDGGKELKLPATNYLIPVDSEGRSASHSRRRARRFPSSATCSSRGHASLSILTKLWWASLRIIAEWTILPSYTVSLLPFRPT
ncbi:hypothetical protein HPP92_006260 [Vanilla planifolia]|uniref:Peptidase A1 domain-containing protein n=1 Tax=Vanilla planifolia TaxID=51239 RepID=A0A835VBQ5_VANPL|nr:hypothetical protein HPP92_006260 [Vanilla planifolia]